MRVIYNKVMEPKFFIALLVVAIAGVGSMFLLRGNELKNTSRGNEVSHLSIGNISTSTRPSETKAPTTYGPAVELIGYHEMISKEYPGGIVHQCDAFALIEGDRDLINELKALARLGNTVNTLDASGRLLLTVDLATSENNLAEIRRSSAANQAKLSVARKKSQGKEARPCEGLVEVLEVEV